MDERDKEWFDHNNEEARGEGTSAQGSVSASTGRTTARSAKAKGKESEEAHSILMSEDEFELVMGLFEKITQEKTEFLHHSRVWTRSLSRIFGISTSLFYSFVARYFRVIHSAQLAASAFASASPCSYHISILEGTMPRANNESSWRIIPRLNFDEANTLNESYVCFRRREKKTVRKTRASQVTSSDKLARLQTELEHPLQLAKHLLAREQLK
ncbi:hypothetical protein BT96DRAFT_316199 [Gymnopus androsaceus JB14]|uniref:Enhancer of polycomb-like N-terminal domain-containing protein n=1 Tax=Gymnopus androsaceus JB14 TaxID=1447944 RepID=A0A6A4IAD2_9AGAR|nr:hypothetical protein BT96DRAFT_316199 [Gymnopus androsaceus JB14]